MIASDPAVRADRKCVVCKRNRVIPRETYATREQYETDPFCSRRCCAKWHGVVGRTITGMDEDGRGE